MMDSIREVVTSRQFREHETKEFYDPGAGSTLDAATKRGYDYFRRVRETPKDFFDPKNR